MVTLIIGGSGSGKSSYGEDYIMACYQKAQKQGILYYVATMKVYGEEGIERVQRHRKQREGKGFVTVEQCQNLPACMKDFSPKREENFVLLECMSNLVANEMFSKTEPVGEEAVVKKVLEDVGKLMDQTEHLVIVTNNVFEDGCQYEEETKSYLRAMGRINRELARLSDHMVEVVVGIPIKVK